MTYFQNPFAAEFRGSWTLGDRQHSLTFVCPQNSGRSDEVVTTWNNPELGVYDLSGNDLDGNSKNILAIRIFINEIWANLEIDLTDNTQAQLDPEPIISAMKPNQIVSILNKNSSFASYFVAGLEKNKIIIKQKFPTSRMKFFVINGRAEQVLGFNKRAGISELPSYFKNYKVYGGELSYPILSTNLLVELSPSNSGGDSSVDDELINNALDNKGNFLNLNSSNLRKDYEFLEGRSGLFIFRKITLDEENRTTEIIEYHAGSKVGNFAKKINYKYNGSSSSPVEITEIPYVLQEEDIIQPEESEYLPYNRIP